eukprot:m.477663 g.477663  ORF g.477663 m.477663 type:complete len:124 (+) comp44319_c0_seq1:3-374(+)
MASVLGLRETIDARDALETWPASTATDFINVVEAGGPVTDSLLPLLEPQDLVALSCTCRALYHTTEDWCRRVGIRLAIDLQKAEIAAIHRHPVGAKVSFAHYEGFLESLLKLPIDDPVAQLPT